MNLNPCVNNVLSGYTDKVSYFPGDEVQVFLQSNSTLVCGLGFYNIRGQLMFKSNISLFPQNVSVDEPWKKGFNFASNGRVILPSTLASGVYLIENKIPIVVKSAAASDVTVVYPCNTINAYSNSGGKSLYGFNSTDNVASHTVSFLRPMNSNGEENECIKCLKWFPNLRNITINYITDLDLDDYSSIALSKVLVVTGHSEYWTRGARINFDRHVNEGKHAVVLSGNTMWWQVRYAETRDALICYKSILLDPITEPALKTTLWADPSLQFSILASIGQDFNHGGYSLQTGNGWNGFKIFNPASPLLQGTSLNKGDILSVPSRECDGAPIAGWDTDGFPVLDNSLFHFAKLELIGFDRGMRGGIETFPTFIVMQKFNTSGIIVNVGSIGWCSALGIGSSPSGNRVEMITQNAIMKLLNGDNVFSN
ncbi:MAG TPA: N,N-dimethylformamidase beta subunit family domain-containing protein [Cyclobacteriaceae bacterium]|nr:N,N-dimethylformamidase beta subunit family domain-containing protein [Cyclobacteriaceae bacterium]